jgi:hypothetical protein
MEISFSNAKLQELCENEKLMTKKLGIPNSSENFTFELRQSPGVERS